jgi:preprotein translocase subunit SecG
MIFLYSIFVIVCVLLMLSVLLQSGKGEGLSGTFGGSAQFMGGRAAATFLTKTTAALATVFMLLSILLSVLTSTSLSLRSRTEAQERMMKTPPQTEAVPTPGQGQTTPAQAVPGGAE